MGLVWSVAAARRLQKWGCSVGGHGDQCRKGLQKQSSWAVKEPSEGGEMSFVKPRKESCALGRSPAVTYLWQGELQVWVLENTVYIGRKMK